MRDLSDPPMVIAPLGCARLDKEPPLRSRCSVFGTRVFKPLDFDELASLLARARVAAPRDGRA